MYRVVLAVVVATSLSVSGIRAQELERIDHYIDGDPGVTLFVREVRAIESRQRSLPAVLLLYGARVPSVPSFDLPVPDYSLAADLANAGFAVYLLDARGYGGSSRPLEMTDPPDAYPPLVLFNTLYGGTDRHDRIGPGSGLEDPDVPGRFNTDYGSYRLSTAESLFGAWDASIPVEEKDQWRDARVVDAYAQAALASDSSSYLREPASFRAPNGAIVRFLSTP